jgi:transposase
MGDGPYARYHLRGNGCPQSDDFSCGCRWGARWGGAPSRQFLNRADHVGKLVERLSKTDGQRLRFCYEAGPCGYGLHRQITDLGHECAVVAPSLIPMKAGDRIKTDRRDAVMLAKLHRAGELTAVWVPDAAMQPMMRCGI